MEIRRQTVSIIGPGTVGTALGVLFARHGIPVAGIAGRNWRSTLDSARRIGCPPLERPIQALTMGQVVLIAVSDDSLVELADVLAAFWSAEMAAHPDPVEEPPIPRLIGHTSGVWSYDALEPLARMGWKTFSLHPMQTLAGVEDGIRHLPGSLFVMEGDPEALIWAREVVEAMGAFHAWVTPSLRPLYHAACSMASNYLVTLAFGAAQLLEASGIESDTAWNGLIPFLRATLDNLEDYGHHGALTGPLSRGDVGTIRRHLQALEEDAQDWKNVYLALATRTLGLVRAQGRVSPESLKLIEDIIKSASGLANPSSDRRGD